MYYNKKMRKKYKNYNNGSIFNYNYDRASYRTSFS